MSRDDYDDPKVKAQWLTEQRDNVHQYLEDAGIQHQGVASEPDWFVAPYVSVWRVGSMRKPGAVGWWAISGDLPTDYLSGGDASDARTALAAFANRWHEVSGYMLRGEEHPTVKIGRPGDRGELGDLLSRRAGIIKDWVDDDTMWKRKAGKQAITLPKRAWVEGSHWFGVPGFSRFGHIPTRAKIVRLREPFSLETVNSLN